MELGQKVVEHLSMDTTYCVVRSEINDCLAEDWYEV